ncbi:uncharacterized protein LOC121385918 [Gigantopelta aegis]|uniref:uncharacterized protein LOC121385918 n=1 Tax=Gigantopelta aegis TaxID=1735272 RepID=UPI001B88C99E|nr:uncharacterized protein LOC121385918 [Gigantopelta aegis]
MDDLQRHIKTWCPINKSVSFRKRARYDEDTDKDDNFLAQKEEGSPADKRPLSLTAATLCPPPPPLLNGNVVYSSLLVGSVASYSCRKDYRFLGLSQSSVCDPSGSWNGVNCSCRRVVVFNNSPIPFKERIPGTVKAGWKVEISGTPLSGSRMEVALGCGAQCSALALSIRFHYECDTNIVLRYSRDGSEWHDGDRDQPYFPFAIGRPFNLTILVKDSTFKLYVDEAYFVSRAHSFTITQINQVFIWEGCLIDSVKFIY